MGFFFGEGGGLLFIFVYAFHAIYFFFISTALFEINNEIFGGFLYKRLKINIFFLRMLTTCILQSERPDKDTVSIDNDDMLQYKFISST